MSSGLTSRRVCPARCIVATRVHKLQTERLALRLREIDASWWITLKGRSQPTEGGVTKQFEVEVRWSREALNNLISELTERGVQILQKHEGFDDANPLDVMRGRGMEVIQDRKTNRQVRRIVPMGENDTSVLAELAIDSVAYYFHDQEVCHHEVEIEAKAVKGSTILNVLVESLIATLGTALRSWSHSKLTTGKAIQNLLHEGALEGMLDNHNNLIPVAYDKIEAFLRSSDI